MILIIGGAFQGKSSYAKERFSEIELWTDGENCAYEEIFSCSGMVHFHRFVQRFLESQALDDLPKRLAEENPEIVIITDELGYGVVPVEAKDRVWREKTGRICTGLASRSKEVHRVICGIGTVIKGKQMIQPPIDAV